MTEYRITPYIGSEAQPATTVTGTPPLTSTTSEGLKNGTPYTFTVQAANPNGAGPVSETSNAVTPSTAIGTLGADGNVAASAATRQALVSWTEPASNGGSPITGYKITPYVGASAQAAVEVPAGFNSATVKGLANGTSYTFTVAAINARRHRTRVGRLRGGRPRDTIFDFADAGHRRRKRLLLGRGRGQVQL